MCLAPSCSRKRNAPSVAARLPGVLCDIDREDTSSILALCDKGVKIASVNSAPKISPTSILHPSGRQSHVMRHSASHQAIIVTVRSRAA